MITTIDPGVRACGIAGWRASALVSAMLVKTNLRGHYTKTWPRGFSPVGGQIVLETMEYHGGRRASVPQDLIDVQTVGCILATALAGPDGDLRLIKARAWMGTVKESVLHRRVQALLSAPETDILTQALDSCPKAHHKEILDAVGIGLFATGRARKGIITCQ